ICPSWFFLGPAGASVARLSTDVPRENAMKLYYMPGACSIGIHVLLEEIGKPYDLHKIDGAKQEQYGPDFVKINPKSKVPTLVRDDGSVLTEFPAIATWLARKNPDKSLLPSDADAEARALEAMTTSCRPCTCKASPACSGRAAMPTPKPITTRSKHAARRSWKRASPSWIRRSRARSTSPASSRSPTRRCS